MFAIPPPPRYPTHNGMPPTPLETANQISHPEGPEYSFQSGEGIYVLREDIQLATPPPHPSEIPVTNPNPLATTTNPPTSGVKLSVITVKPRQVRNQLNRANTTTSNLLRWRALGRQDTNKAKDTKEVTQVDADAKVLSDASSDRSAIAASTRSSTAPAFGEGNIALTLTNSRDVLKRRKPKNNMVKSNSSFVSRVIPHDHLTKRLAERDSSGSFAFVNVNRAFQWLDMSSSTKAEPLTKILFTKAHMLCHDVNPLTKDETHIDVLMGSSASDIIWYEPISQKYARINKNGMINSTPVSKIKWIPGSESLFLAAHQDGSLVVYDKEKEDAPFVPEVVIDEAISIEDDPDSQLNVTKSVNSANQKANPVACWKLCSQPINDFAFSPDSRHLAVVAEDGYLRIVDYLKETLRDVFSSYYGGFTCVCWSPDGKYILTGGQDDLVSIWSLADRQIVARCPGHDSWVTAVAFDPWRCDDKTYRFGSIGDDCKLLLWDFSVGMLHRPKGTLARARGSVSGQSFSLNRHRTESASVNRMRSNSSRSQGNQQEDDEAEADFLNHPIEPRARTAQLPPVMVKTVDPHPLCGLAFEQDCIITSCQDGHVRTWDRPAQDAT
ncbi:hypothetical protein LTR64_003121 [Lithohypha guttulata]|uniref:uncharacterized protein n=1 Tax=Lithohypha guttulata TaxID=1690604 RepID=UPI002DE0E0D5|nr:hypothetical protein LTR51_000656 [Lithohypha guttulata]